MQKMRIYKLMYLVLFQVGFLFGMEGPSRIKNPAIAKRIQEIHEILSKPVDIESLGPEMYQNVYLYPKFEDIGKSIIAKLYPRGREAIALVPDGADVRNTPAGPVFEVEGDTIYKLFIPWFAYRALKIFKDGTSYLHVSGPEEFVWNLEGEVVGNINNAPYNVIRQRALVPFRR